MDNGWGSGCQGSPGQHLSLVLGPSLLLTAVSQGGLGTALQQASHPPGQTPVQKPGLSEFPCELFLDWGKGRPVIPTVLSQGSEESAQTGKELGKICLASRLFPKQFTLWIEKWVAFLRLSLEAR